MTLFPAETIAYQFLQIRQFQCIASLNYVSELNSIDQEFTFFC